MFFTTTDVTNALYSDRRMIDNVQWALNSYFLFLLSAIMAAECRRAEARVHPRLRDFAPVARWSQEARSFVQHHI